MSKEEWNGIIDAEEGQKTAILIVEQVMEKVSSVIFAKRIQNQLIPYTLQYVKSVSMDIVNWRFLKKDNGTLDRETWEIDAELAPIQPDSWARGILKVEKEIPKEVEQENVPKIKNKEWKVSCPELTIRETKPHKAKSIHRPVLKRPEKSKEIIEPVKKLTVDQIIKQENKKLLNRIHHIEKDGNLANYTYDSDGKITLIRKSAPVKAFNPQVSVNVVEEKEKTSKINLTARKVKRSNQKIKKEEPMVYFDEIQGFVPDDSLDSPILADVIKVAPGVVFKEGQTVKSGGKFVPTTAKDLQPHPPTDGTIKQNDEILTRILEKARPFVKIDGGS